MSFTRFLLAVVAGSASGLLIMLLMMFLTGMIRG